MKNITLILILLFSTFFFPAFSQSAKRNATIKVQAEKTDSTHVVNFIVTDEKNIPVKDVTVSVYVKRMFGMMKMGDVFTDSIGFASIAFSNELPGGDSLANIFVVAKIEDNELLNDTSAEIIIKSTIPYQRSQQVARSTFSSRAPIWLLVTFSILFGGVWLVYLRVIALIMKIKKAGSEIS